MAGYLWVTRKGGVPDAIARGRVPECQADPLTALLNRRAFYDDAARLMALCRRAGRPMTLAYIDLDNFKAVNDTLGHEAGDEVLRAVAGQLLAATRPADLCARVGGDESVVLLPELGVRDAAVTLERLRMSFEGSATSGRPHVSVSVGGVTFVTIPDDVEQMIQAADARMYVAKRTGKNRVLHEIVGGAGRLEDPALLRTALS